MVRKSPPFMWRSSEIAPRSIDFLLLRFSVLPVVFPLIAFFSLRQRSAHDVESFSFIFLCSRTTMRPTGGDFFFLYFSWCSRLTLLPFFCSLEDMNFSTPLPNAKKQIEPSSRDGKQGPLYPFFRTGQRVPLKASPLTSLKGA